MRITPHARSSDRQRLASGGAITLVGIILLSIPVYDMWDDISALDWSLLVTLLENATFILLAAGVALGGIWLVRNDWQTYYVSRAAKWTIGGLVAATLLFGWVVYLQLQAMGKLKPYVIAMDGVLIGTAMTFGLGLLSARTEITRSELGKERAAKASLDSLHQIATGLQETEAPEEAYEVVLDAVGTVIAPDHARIVIEDEVVRERSYTERSPSDAGTTVRKPIGGRGAVELLDGGVFADDERTLELLATHLDQALGRIDRERTLAEERRQFAFVNRTLRHDLENSLNVVAARLQLVEEQCDLPDDHWDVVTRRTEEMQTFVRRMSEYMQLLEQDDHELEPVNLRQTVEAKVETVQSASANATFSVADLPDVEVKADDLLESLFENLLRNAVEHNDEEQPEVQVRGELENDTVTIEVVDNGPGIPDEHKSAILERGVQGEDSSGTGFGLHLVREAVDTYNGNLQIQDNDPEGTIVRVTLSAV